MANIIWGSTSKPESARRLANMLKERDDLTGTLYVGYPILGTPDGAFRFDALLLDPQYGLFAIDIVEGREAGEYFDRQDEIASKLHSKLLQYPKLLRRRKLAFDINVITFAPAAPDAKWEDDDYPIFKDAAVLDHIVSTEFKEQDRFPNLAAAVQAISNIRKSRRKRGFSRDDSRGAKLQKLNDSIANLDANQGAAVIETVEGVQRIRGLAGSGKTIVLALKVAYLHAQNPDWDIVVTFNTRSLREQFKRLITDFVLEQTNERPDWEKIKILHSWGSPSLPEGVYYRFTRDHEIPYYDFRSAQQKFGDGKEFSGACQEALKNCVTTHEKYDAILIDEAQDLPASFMQLCYRYLRDPKRLVYAYDELQTLTNSSLPPPEELFGLDDKGNPVVSFSTGSTTEARQDIILEKCYRNPRPILATAHAMGFGIYREPDGLIQIFDQHHLWQDVGYRVRKGDFRDNTFVSLERTEETSPRFLESHSPLEDLIQFCDFETKEEQDRWLVDNILHNLREDELSAEDIVVINPDPLKTRKAVSRARSLLFEEGVNSSLAGVTNSPDIFFEQDVITFTGIFRAKGNEAAMVYIINAQDCFNAFFPVERARIRNQLFTALTRSKAWVRVLGTGEQMKLLAQEFERIKEHNFRLDFTYPSEERRKELRIINREMTRTEQTAVQRNVEGVARALSALDEGDMKLEDLPKELRERLRKLLGGGDETA